MSTRGDLARELRPLIPKSWSIENTDRNLPELTKTALLISQRRIEPAPNAQGNHRVTLFLYVIEPKRLSSGAEDSLDNATDEACFALDKLSWLLWSTAEKVMYQGHRAYQITITAASEPKE